MLGVHKIVSEIESDWFIDVVEQMTGHRVEIIHDKNGVEYQFIASGAVIDCVYFIADKMLP